MTKFQKGYNFIHITTKNSFTLTLDKLLSKTEHSEVWKLQNLGKHELVVKFVTNSFDFGDGEISEINSFLQDDFPDFKNYKLLGNYEGMSKYFFTGFKKDIDCIYIVSEFIPHSLDEFDNKKELIQKIFENIYNLHYRFYTMNNIWENDIRVKKNGDVVFIDLKAVLLFGEELTPGMIDQDNNLLSLNLLQNNIPDIYDDIESVLYLYYQLVTNEFPKFKKNQLQQQIKIKETLDFMESSTFGKSIQELILGIRDYKNENPIPEYNSSTSTRIREIVDEVYSILSERFEEIIFEFNVVKIPEVEQTIFSASQNELIKIYCSKLQIFRNNKGEKIIPDEDTINFALKVFNMVTMGSKYDENTNKLILLFLDSKFD